uniref:Protein-PII uridylyltransferase N-terminal domain-containing protein n=1 Tax=Branchiostoma floridae TaxID=7739 RepID=C3ZHS0_BRAFL|eukprot:XP_002591853.1 hypothetical protein BRAFLDRAFT_125514 [Branchiostoma floridae]
MDRCVEVEVLKSLGDVNLEKGRLDKNPEKFDRAMMLYRTALIRCEDAEVGESLVYRYHYAEKLRLGKRSTAQSSYEPLTDDKKLSSLAIAEKLLHLERKLTVVGNKETLLLIEYTKLVADGIINGDTMLEMEALKSLGDVYLKRGRRTKDSTNLTKATALYNTALARCEEFQGKVALIHRLKYTARIRIQENQKHRAQQLGHVQREFPMTSPDTGVIGDTNSQQSTSRSYEEHLTTGDRALADGKLDVAEQDFASALRLIHDCNKPDLCKEAECLCRLGDVYVQRGKRTREGRNFTQAASLYNAALARTDSELDTNTAELIKRLQDTEQWFLQQTANIDTKIGSPDSSRRHQKRLQEMRMRAKSQIDAIDQQHNPYQYEEDSPDMITVEAERAEAVKVLCKNIAQDRRTFIQDLVNECIAILGPPPCKYAFIGLGSQATELVTPYSDLEFAILIEDGKDNDDTRSYFINLTHYLHLKVINLGETILPAMAIPSLNDFKSKDPEKDWFFDSVTPRGFAFDGFMPWACKTPFGRDQTKTKPPVSLIQTPIEMAKFQRLEVSLAEGYHLSDILRRVVFLVGNGTLVTEYMGKLKEIQTNALLSRVQSRLSAALILRDNMEQFSTFEPTGQLLDVKKDIYRFPDIAIEVLALCCQISLASTWDVVNELTETETFNDENATHLTVLTSISAELRLRTYLANGGQRDNMSPLVEMKFQQQMQSVPDTTLRSVFHIPDTNVLFRYYCRAIPLKKCIVDMIENNLELQPNWTILDTSHEYRGRIAKNLFLLDQSIRHLEAALTDAGSDNTKRSEILRILGTSWVSFGNITKGIRLLEESLSIRKSIYGDNTTHPDIAASLNNLGSSWSQLGDQKKAISCYEQSLTMAKTIYGDNTAHPDIAASLDNLGICYHILGDQKTAIRYFEQGLTMQKTMYGDNMAHPDIAGSFGNLGISWSNLGNEKRAIRYYEQSLTMQKTIYGNNTAHPDIAKSLSNLGSSWGNLGDDKKAITYYEQSISMTKTIYGVDIVHPEIASSLVNLGLSCSKLGDHKKAIMYYKQSLAMMQTVYGENTAHPEIAALLTNLGSAWNKLGDQRKAIKYGEQSLSMQRTIHGDNTAHLNIAKSLHNLGSYWSRLRDHKKAISYCEQSLSMMKTIHGDNTAHPDIVASLNNLGSSWGELCDHRKAISYKELALSMEKTVYGHNTAHPDIARSLRNLGVSWGNLGDHKKAISYYEQSLSMEKTIYGDNPAHPDTAASLNNLGSAWHKLGVQNKKAISYYEQALTMMKIVYGDNTAHPDIDIAALLQNLGCCWSKLGDHKKAISYYEQSITTMKTIHGDNTAHPDIAASLNNLGTSWVKCGDLKKARSYFEQSLTMRKAIYGETTAHPSIAGTLNNLRLLWTEMGDEKRAMDYMQQLQSMQMVLKARRHPHP